MTRRRVLKPSTAILITMMGFASVWPGDAVYARPQHGGHHHAPGNQGRGGLGGFGPGFGVGFPYVYAPVFVLGPGMFLAPTPMMMPIGPLMPRPVPGLINPPPLVPLNGRGVRARAADPARANQLLIVGDRLLRAANLKKAEERYLQAMRAAPIWPRPEFAWHRWRSPGEITRKPPRDFGKQKLQSRAGLSRRRISRRFSVSHRSLPSKLRESSRTCRQIHKIETHGWFWERSGFCRGERRRRLMSSSDWRIRRGSRMLRWRLFWRRRIRGRNENSRGTGIGIGRDRAPAALGRDQG